MRDGAEDIIIKRNKYTIRCIEYLLCPLICCGICLGIDIIGFHPTATVRLIIGGIYALVLFSIYYSLHEDNIDVLGDFVLRCKSNSQYFQTETLPKDIPLPNDGFLYAKKNGESYSNPYPIKNSVRSLGRDIDMNDVFQYSIAIDDLERHKEGYLGEDYSQFKYCVAKGFENQGFSIEAIKNKFGDYIWIKGKNKDPRKNSLKWATIKILLIRAMIFICSIMPLIWALCPHNN